MVSGWVLITLGLASLVGLLAMGVAAARSEKTAKVTRRWMRCGIIVVAIIFGVTVLGQLNGAMRAARAAVNSGSSSFQFFPQSCITPPAGLSYLYDDGTTATPVLCRGGVTSGNCLLVSGTTNNCLLVSGTTSNTLLVR